MKKRSSILALFGLAIMFLSLSACSKDDDKGVEGGSSSTLSINGEKISKIVTSQVEGDGFLLDCWFNDWYFEFEFKYYGSVSKLSAGDDITEDIRIRRCSGLNEMLVDASYDIIDGSVSVASVSSKTVTLKFSNLNLQEYLGSSKRKEYTFNGNVTYDIFD